MKNEYPKTDSGNALLFADMFHEKIRFDLTSGKWVAWDGKRWNREKGENKAQCYSRGVGVYWYQLLGDCEDKKKREKIFRHWQYTCSATGIRNLLFLAKSEPNIAVSHEEWDKHPYYFNVLDGTIDLRTGDIKEHDPKDLLTQLAPVVYDKDIECPNKDRWDDCMRTWHPDGKTDGTWDYLQQLMGYCLTGDTTSRCFPIFWGSGKNGKNVFLDTFLLMMGDYATVAPRTLIEASGREEHPAEIADLWGKRLVLASEPKKGTKLKTSLVKAMTGDSRMKARFMRQDFFEFTPTHKVIMLTQNLPQIDETTDAIWDRIHKLRWGVRIDREKQDPKLTEKLRKDWTGILRWAVEGGLKWQKRGILLPTAKIEREVGDYRDAQNPAKNFIESNYIFGKRLFIASADMRNDLSEWNRFSDLELLSIGEVHSYIKEKDCFAEIRKFHGSPIRGWSGIGKRGE